MLISASQHNSETAELAVLGVWVIRKLSTLFKTEVLIEGQYRLLLFIIYIVKNFLMFSVLISGTNGCVYSTTFCISSPSRCSDSGLQAKICFIAKTSFLPSRPFVLTSGWLRNTRKGANSMLHRGRRPFRTAFPDAQKQNSDEGAVCWPVPGR